MSWRLQVSDLGPTESLACQKAGGCLRYASHHVVAHEIGGDGRPTGARRYAALCQDHVAEAQYQTAIAVTPATEPAAAPSARHEAAPGSYAGTEVVPRAPRPKLTFPLPEGATPTTCRSCAAAVYWIITASNRRMPIDAFGETKGQSHFSTCQNADQHRKARK